MQNKTYTLIHLSDLHLLSLKGMRWKDLFNKRIYGLLSHLLTGKAIINYEFLSHLLEKEISKIQPNWIVFSGDLTHLSLAQEFKQGKKWLTSLAKYAQAIAVPGNHDHYVLNSNTGVSEPWKSIVNFNGVSGDKDTNNILPTTIISPPLVFIGLDTSLPNPPFYAYGQVGEQQLRKLDAILEDLQDKNLFKILILHYSPDNALTSGHKKLLDSDKLLNILYKHPVHMILHGHTHKQSASYLDSAENVKTFGISSISALNKKENKRSAINIFEIQNRNTFSWKMNLRVKTYFSRDNCFMDTLHQEYIL